MQENHSPTTNSNWSPKKTQNPEKPKPIILITLHNPSHFLINCDFLRSFFIKFGFVKKILIFDTNTPIKAFIEMSSADEALKAKTELNNTFLIENLAKIYIYFSDLSELKLPEGGIKQCKDYTKEISPEIKKDSNLHMIHEEEEENKDRTPLDDKPPGLEKTFKNFQMKKGIFIEKKRSLDTNDEIFEKINKHNLIQSAMYENYINKTPSTSESGLLMKSPNLLDVLSASLTIKTPFLQNKLEDEIISKVLYVKGFSNKTLNVHHIYNLFSNFGEIRKIILIRVKEIGLIEFENIEYAKTAKEFLNNLFYISDYLKITFSNYKEIIPKNIAKNTSKEDLLICNIAHNRFTQDKKLIINPPSQILHLSNFDKNCCNEENIKELFKDIAQIDTIKILNGDEFKKMCLVKFTTLEQALVAISFCHNKELGGRKIKISFTKSKI